MVSYVHVSAVNWLLIDLLMLEFSKHYTMLSGVPGSHSVQAITEYDTLFQPTCNLNCVEFYFQVENGHDLRELFNLLTDVFTA